jgi:hypothetical protein
MADERGRFSERFSRYSERPFDPLRDFFGFFWKIFKFILAIVVFLFIILLLYGFLTGGYQSGILQYTYENTINFISKMPFLPSLAEVFKTVQDPSRVARTFDWQAEVDKNSENKELGLTFQKFTSIKSTYLPDEPISFIGTVKAASLKDNSKVRFECKAVNSKVPGTIEPSEPVSLQKDLIKVFSVRCEIPENTIKLDGKKIKGETVVLNANYDFKTEAYVEIYTMSEKLLTEEQNNKEDVFNDIINSRLNKQTGEVRSQYTQGPMKILINSGFTQPFTEAGPFLSDSYYNLGILIEKGNSLYQGKLNKVNEVYLYLPKNFELNDKEDQFELIESEDEVFNKYRLKQEKINKLNSVCKDVNLLDTECLNYWERGFTIAETKFRIVSLNKEDIDTNYLRAEVEYEFQAQTSKTVKIVESQIA